MSRRLMLFSAASITICLTFGLAIHLFLSDVVPAAWGEEPNQFLRLETAVLLTTLQWITGIVGLLAAAAVVVLQYRRIFTA